MQFQCYYYVMVSIFNVIGQFRRGKEIARVTTEILSNGQLDTSALTKASKRRLCAKILHNNHRRAVQALIRGNGSPRVNRFEDSPEIFEARVGESLNLLIGHLNGRDHFGELYAGQIAIELVRPELTPDENLTTCRVNVTRDLEILKELLKPLADEADIRHFETLYLDATASLTARPTRHVRTLFVGDCLMAEVSTFLLGPLAKNGISIQPFPINARDPEGLRLALNNLSSQQYDMIFFSPFSHARTPELEIFAAPVRLPQTRAALGIHVTAIIEQTGSLIQYLSNRFECPIFINNASFLQRTQSTIKSLLGSMIGGKAASYARSRINLWLGNYVSVHNKQTYPHLFIVDEEAIAREHGRRKSSLFLHSSPFQHATVLSQKIAAAYHTRISVGADMVGRKLVICDLDNTIWDGVIGEGAVSHFLDRQKILKRLKDTGGIVLSIASKNDPSNVHFRDSLLSARDFVSPQISWDSKIDAISRIQATLNLQTKHMIFVDDRADERALVSEAFPDMLVLDACATETWSHLDLWSNLIEGSSDLDRTTLYQEQALREASVSLEIAGEARNASLEKLKLCVTVEAASKSDLKRVAELINRTNQWNLTGARTSFEQIKGLNDSANGDIIVAAASDRFGAMGMVCVAIVQASNVQAVISTLVLSCRVFGYGVETAVVSEIAKKWARGGRQLVGKYRSTNQNHLCRTMYSDQGFIASGEDFIFEPKSTMLEIPSWLEVKSSL